MVSEFAASLRRKLIREHLGLLHPDLPNRYTENSQPLPDPNSYDWGSAEDRAVRDPLSQHFWDLLTDTAQKNTSIFREIFLPMPDDTSKCVSYRL